MLSRNRWSRLAWLGCAIAAATTAEGQLPAFPGADGAANAVTGGRGGMVYHVTEVDLNFSDNRPGTLRYGMNDSNFGGQARTIVFDVAGTFWLGRYGEERGHDNGWDTQSRLNLGSNVTIAGQTAPGPVNIMGGVVKVGGNNMILRNVTIAPGYGMRSFEKPDEDPPELPTPGDFPDSYTYDALDISGTDLMIDHVTTVYATDETISANETANRLTIQYSNISQGQNYPQADAEASGVKYTGHALGSLLQAGSNARVSVHHNLYAHQKGRLPRVGSEEGSGAYNDFRNNVFYNWLGTAGGGAGGQASFNNFIGNFFLAGDGGEDPVGGSSTAITNRGGGTGIFDGNNSSGTRVYHAGNVKDTNKDGDAEDTVALTNSDFRESNLQGSPYGQATYRGHTDSATDAYDQVLDYVGARWWDRGPVDTRLVEEVRTGTGQIEAWADDPFDDDPNEGVEWRELLALRADPVTHAAPFSRGAGWDTDGDGMPNHWEEEHGLPTDVANNNADFDNDGYTDLEEYLNDVAAWPASEPIVFDGSINSRYALTQNWNIPWQPSRYDEVLIGNTTAVVDAVGQHAGTIEIGASGATSGSLVVSDGWLKVAEGIGVGDNNGVTDSSLVLSGGELFTPFIGFGYDGLFSMTGGKLHAGQINYDLVNEGGILAPGYGAEAGIGRTVVNSNLTLASGALEIEVAAANLADLLVVNDDVQLGGELDVVALDGFLPSDGDRWEILLHTGALSGAFATIAPGYYLEYARYDQMVGVLSLVAGALPGDFNGDGAVDAADFTVWRDGLDTDYVASDYDLWVENFGRKAGSPLVVAPSASVPEPAAALLAATAAFLAFAQRRPTVRGVRPPIL
ncbi:hypothetical protein [Pseudobythopirellula maris]|nr:hypothetical protein [Pseudobythopirellula maris]